MVEVNAWRESGTSTWVVQNTSLQHDFSHGGAGGVGGVAADVVTAIVGAGGAGGRNVEAVAPTCMGAPTRQQETQRRA